MVNFNAWENICLVFMHFKDAFYFLKMFLSEIAIEKHFLKIIALYPKEYFGASFILKLIMRGAVMFNHSMFSIE